MRKLLLMTVGWCLVAIGIVLTPAPVPIPLIGVLPLLVGCAILTTPFEEFPPHDAASALSLRLDIALAGSLHSPSAAAGEDYDPPHKASGAAPPGADARQSALRRTPRLMALLFDRSFTAPYGEAVPLSPSIRRVLANNPGPFTFTGTGTYIVGTRDVAVIDPGPSMPDHIEALKRALSGLRRHAYPHHAYPCRSFARRQSAQSMVRRRDLWLRSASFAPG